MLYQLLKSKPTSKSVNGQTTSHRAPGKRKKKRASYLSAYEENFTMDCFDGRRGKKPLLHMNQKSEVFVYEKFLSEEGLRAAPEHLFIREVRILAIS
ncbi:hypothetical protein EB796_010416 [Bugula neritina]|uniref:Uncharacterized protein n=1 Tax=Bugula neritina TaxID=10212 RepID=A0A7J7JZ79_BUGNE|nr:hypothetical protein EB796_010416 [Bugula neritina]